MRNLFIIGLFLIPTLLSAVTRYVDSTTLFGFAGCGGLLSYSYPTVQSAINNANAGDTISICSGTYTENNIGITKNNLVIKSQSGNRADVTVKSTSSPTFTIKSANTTIRDITIQSSNYGITNNYQSSGSHTFNNLAITAVSDGIYLDLSGGNTFSNLAITSTAGQGINLAYNAYGSHTFSDINITSYGNGIQSDHSTALSLNTINITSSNGRGIHSGSGITSLQNFAISSSSYGIYNVLSQNTSIRNGTITATSANGIEFVWGSQRSVDLQYLTINSGAIGVNLPVASAAVMDHLCINTSTYGIYADWNAYNVSVSNSKINGNSNYDIYIASSPSNRATITSSCFQSSPFAYRNNAAHTFNGNYWNGTPPSGYDSSPLGSCPISSCYGQPTSITPSADYRFDECQWDGATGEVEDNSTNSYNATPKSANGSDIPQVSAQIINNGALFVRANQQYVELPTIAQSTPNFNDGFTVTAWAKFSGSAGFWERIFDIGNGTNVNNIFLGRQNTTNNLVLGIHDPGTSQYLVANGAISDTNWHFWGATCDGSGGCKLYKDGVKIAESTTMKIPANVARTKNYIGKSNWSADAYLEGGVDELKFFDAMLSDAEITTIYTNESSGKNYDGTTRTSVDCNVKPIADYRFDECQWDGTSGEIKDSSDNHLDGIALNGATTDTNTSIINNSAILNDEAATTQYIEIPDDDLLDDSNKLTIMGWINPSTYTPVNGNALGVFSKRTSSSSEYAYGALLGYEFGSCTSDKLVIDIDGTNNRFCTNSSIPLNQWTHFAIVYNGSLSNSTRVKVYLNGVLDTTATETSSTLPNSIAPLRIGSLYDSASNPKPFKGNIDEFKIYRFAFNQSKIQEIISFEQNKFNFDGTTREASCCCVPTGGNLIANPSFETLCGTSIIQTWNTAGGIVNMRDNVCGWTMNGNGMETWENTTSPAANDGAVFVEIDGDGTTVDQLSQTIKTLYEIHYVISFDYRARNGGSDRIIAKWNGVEIDTFTGITSEWQTAQIEVVGTGSDTLAFEEPSADNNSYGSWIDNVRLIEGTLSPQNFGFDAWDSFRSISDRNISTKIVGKDFNLTIASLNDEKTGFQDFNGTVCVALVNNSAQPISGWNKLFFNDQNTSLTTLVLDKAIGGDENAGVQITWKKNVDVLCPLVGESNSTIASDRFAVRPERFSITTLSNPIAGVDFNLTFSAPIFDSNTPASDYNETVGDTFDVTIAEQNASCITGVLTPNNLLFSFENGTRTLLTRYSEVGKLDINITETTKPCGSRFAQIDCDDANVFDGTALTQDILPIASENMTISVIPHHFDLNATLKNGNNTYTYLSTDLNMSASLDLLISAKNFQNEVTQNYSDACYAQSTSYTVDYVPLTISPSGSLKQLIYHYLDTENIDINETSFTLDANRSIFSAGEGSISLNFNFDRNETKPVNPFTFTLNSINVIDSDNVTGEDPTDQNATFVFGRTHAYDMTTNDTEAPNPIEIEIYGKNSSHSFLIGKPQNTIYWYRNTDHNGVLGGAVLSGDDYPSTTKTAGASSSIVVTTTTPPSGGLQWINIQNNDSITTPKTIHLSINRWLWYSSLQSYSDLDGSNCTQHPCFKYNFTVDSSSTTTPFRGSDFNIAPAQDVTQKGAKFFR